MADEVHELEELLQKSEDEQKCEDMNGESSDGGESRQTLSHCHTQADEAVLARKASTITVPRSPMSSRENVRPSPFSVTTTTSSSLSTFSLNSFNAVVSQLTGHNGQQHDITHQSHHDKVNAKESSNGQPPPRASRDSSRRGRGGKPKTERQGCGSGGHGAWGYNPASPEFGRRHQLYDHDLKYRLDEATVMAWFKEQRESRNRSGKH